MYSRSAYVTDLPLPCPYHNFMSLDQADGVEYKYNRSAINRSIRGSILAADLREIYLLHNHLRSNV